MDTRQLTTSDGQELSADLLLPAREPFAGIVVCHPHPLYGGNRHNPVVDAIFRRLPLAGLAALRFDFRAVHGGGIAERLDVIAALDALVAEVGDVPLAVAGYSFGAAVALTTTDDRIAARSLVAPPLAMIGSSTIADVPTQLLMPRHDQFTKVQTALEFAADRPEVELDVIESADHFLAGHTATVADRAATWLTRTVVV